MTTAEPEQPPLLGLAVAARRAPRRPQPWQPTDQDPVARVLVDTGLAHLDRPFDYLVTQEQDGTARPGVRVRVRFAGQDLPGLLLERVPASEHVGRLAPLRTVVSPEQVLTPHVLALAQTLAARCAGSVGDVLRLAVPPRHAAAERALPQEPPELGPLEAPPPTAWRRYPAGPAFLEHLAGGGAPAASLLALPTTASADDWSRLLAQAAARALSAGRGAVLVVPDHRDLARLDAALTATLGPGRHVRLSADQGPQARYTAYLRILRGHVQVVAGTRAAAYAPVRDLGLVAWWDDGDDLHDEPRAPYAPVREVLAVRAELAGAALLSAGWSRSATLASWVQQGRLQSVSAPASTHRGAVPGVVVAGEGTDAARDAAVAAAHIPTRAWEIAKAALDSGPVLVQVPRRGYVPALSCQDCRRPARCRECSGPLVVTAPGRPPGCRWCGRLEVAFACASCGGQRLRSAVVGAGRTAEELGRAFPGTPVRTSGGGTVLDEVTGARALVVATPGAEPVAAGGYAAALLLDAWALLDRARLDAGEEALRRWLGAAALVRGRADGGEVVLCGAPRGVVVPAVEALVRWAPAWFADTELSERAGLALPPAQWVATLTGTSRAVQSALGELALTSPVRVFGPLPHGADGQVRAMLSSDPALGPDLAARLRALRASASARKDPEPVTVVVAPRDPTA